MSVTFESSELKYILNCLSQFYIANEEIGDLLEYYQFTIPLQNFLCFCYGADYTHSTSPRKIEVFQFIGSVAHNKGYYIQPYELPSLDDLESLPMLSLSASHVYHVNDCNQLRQHIFNFHDKTSLFRSTLFYVPHLHKMYRIHAVISFVTLPVYRFHANLPDLTTSTDIEQLLILPQKFLVNLTKKKQILSRLQQNIYLCEQSIKAHGSLEQSLLK
jgi:hypothetical protein